MTINEKTSKLIITTHGDSFKRANWPWCREKSLPLKGSAEMFALLGQQ
jgi:hypothetical protein